MRTFFKSTIRMFKRHLTRFFTIVAIIFVSLSLMFGISEVENKIDNALSNYYIDSNISDFIIKSQSASGFSAEDIEKLQEIFGEENLMQGFSYDTYIGEDIVRIYSLDLDNITINKLELVEGEMPTSENEILVEHSTKTIKSYNIGDTVTIETTYGEVTYTVCGIVVNPLIIHESDEPSYISDDPLDNVIYINSSQFIVGDVYATITNRTLFNAYSDEYEDEINSIINELKQSSFSCEITILSLYENTGLYSLHSYADKVGKIAIIFVVFFLLVTALVIFSTMTRLLDEERSQIACLKTLGYSNMAIISKYIIFITLATILGSVLAGFCGLGIAKILYNAFSMQFYMPPFPSPTSLTTFFILMGIILISAILVLLLTGLKLLSTNPSALLLAKTPKSGKKVFLERISFIWKKLSFKYKSSFRNVFLFKSRFLMTVISIIGSTVLVLAGFGLLDNALIRENSSSIVMIAVTLIVFAGLLCALVIYNITNINISERNREISTLMVLGYLDKEVSNYIFREVYIMSFIGAILGIPIGYLFLDFVFNFISFGSTADVNWWTWILAPVVTMFFTFISTMLLYKKIVRTDMNESLKTLE